MVEVEKEGCDSLSCDSGGPFPFSDKRSSSVTRFALYKTLVTSCLGYQAFIAYHYTRLLAVVVNYRGEVRLGDLHMRSLHGRKFGRVTISEIE